MNSSRRHPPAFDTFLRTARHLSSDRTVARWPLTPRQRTEDFVASQYLIGRVGGEALGAALTVNRGVRRLLLPGNALGDRGVAAVARAITASRVTYLDLSVRCKLNARDATSC